MDNEQDKLLSIDFEKEKAMLRERVKEEVEALEQKFAAYILMKANQKVIH